MLHEPRRRAGRAGCRLCSETPRSLPPALRPVLVASLVLLPACASSPAAEPPDPAVDAERAALVLEQATRLESPLRIIFDWSLNEQGMRISGRGVTRMEPPYRARLDLFAGNGETVARAGMVGGDLRLPRGTPPGIIPPGPFLWASLGVFRPGEEAELLGGRYVDDGDLQLRYRLSDGDELLFRVRGRQVLEVARLEQGRVLERLTARHEGDSLLPVEATYRHLGDFRELNVRRDSVARVESYPPDIWDPNR